MVGESCDVRCSVVVGGLLDLRWSVGTASRRHRRAWEDGRSARVRLLVWPRETLIRGKDRGGYRRVVIPRDI